MWRTVIVREGERITLSNGNIRVAKGEEENVIPLADVYALLIESRAALVSVETLSALAEAGAHVYFCNGKHLPVAVSVPYNTHFKPLAVVKRQLGLSEKTRGELWQRIVKKKIENQAKCLRFAGVDKQKAEELEQLAKSVRVGDEGGAEAIAAKKYFAALFGSGFVRRYDDITNAALNYGYTVFRSCLCKTLAVYGFHCELGLHHKSEDNGFNLADDLIEPFRPLVDLWTDDNCDNLFGELNKKNRKELVNLTNVPMLLNGRKMRVRNVMDDCVSSLTSAMEKEDASLLKLPDLLPIDEFFEED